jgi:hypothetical protein
VLNVERKWFPDVNLTLDLSKIGDPAALNGRGAQDRLAVFVRTKRTNQPFVSNLKNVNLAGAYYLLPGDLIQGAMRYENGSWSLDSLARIPLPSSPTASSPKVASLQVELNADRDTYYLGEDVRLTLIVSNRGAAPATFNFSNGQKCDFAVRQDGREIWRWSRSRTFDSKPFSVTLNPGETLNFNGLWPGVDNEGQPASPGDYTAAGWMTATGKGLITESSVEIELKDTDESTPISDLISSPKSYVNKQVELRGFYRAHLAERGESLTRSGPPVSRSDWILQDTSGSIYIHTSNKTSFTDADINKTVKVKGLLRMNPDGVLYIWAWDAKIVPDESG